MKMQQFEEPPPELRKTVEQLSSRKADRRQQAEQALEQLGPEKVETLLGLLVSEAKKRKERRKWMIGVIAGYITLIIIVGVLSKGGAVGGMFGGMTAMIAGLMAMSQTQKNATKALAQYDDLRMVGFLAEALESNDKNLVSVAEAKLIELLPRLQASDAWMLNRDQRACLYRALKGKKPALILAILKGCEQVGDTGAIPFVERLANGEGAAARDPRLLEAAIECLPFLRERARQLEEEQTLLRAASAADVITPGDTLLRPTTAAPSQTPPEELLRASAPQE